MVFSPRCRVRCLFASDDSLDDGGVEIIQFHRTVFLFALIAYLLQ